METAQEQYIQFDLGERIFICSLKTLQKYPNSTLANCLKHSDSTEKGTTISLECDSKYFQWILDYMRDGRLDKMDSLSQHEVKQLSKEAKFFCLDELVELCELRIKTHSMAYGCLEPKIIISRLELEEILKEDKKTGDFTVLLNVDRLGRSNIAELIELGPGHNFKLLICRGSIIGYYSEFYQAGKLVKCSDDHNDLLSPQRSIPDSTLAKCIEHSDNKLAKGATISLECDKKYFHWILDYLRDGELSSLVSMSHYEIEQLRKEGKFFRLNDLKRLCDQNPKFSDTGILIHQMIGNRSEFDEILERARKTGKCTLLVNVDMVKRAEIKRILDIES